MTLTKICAKCGLADSERHRCKLTGRSIADTDFCSSFTDHPTQCDLCQKITMSPSYEQCGDTFYLFCRQCGDALTSCGGCEHSAEGCRFKSDPVQMPETIVKQIQTPQGVAQMRIPNPERQNVTCALGCPCWNKDEKTCNKEFNICGNYLLNIRGLPQKP